MSPTPRTPQEPRKSEQQLHYESLANYLKYSVGIAGGLIVVVASVAIYFSFGDRKSMNDENDKLRSDFKSQMTEIRTDANESRRELATRYNSELERFDKSIVEMKADAKDRQASLSSRYDEQLQELKQSSNNQVASIVSETRKAATEQTQKEIAAILQTDRVQKIIEQNAIGELKDKLPSVMATYMRDLPQILEAAGWFDNGLVEGEARLKELSISESEFTRAISKKLYDKIIKKHEDYASSITDSSVQQQLTTIGVVLPLHLIVDNKYPANITDINNLEALIRVIKNKENQWSYYQIGPAVKSLSTISGKQFHLLDNDAILKWYDGLTKRY